MAESHEMLLDVKLDLKDVNDSCLMNWVNWMKCHVKIDAIECLPCYLKVSFYHEDDVQREYPFSIIRLNIPGVRVGSAASRTKSFTYGIFWKNNRKRCRLFLAFQDKQSCSMHMKWLKRSIDSLEFYRKDILENHRISRTILSAVQVADDEYDQQFNNSKVTLNDTQTERDMNDILGPLPEIPTSNGDSCNRLSNRRSSGCSGIYEEILDPTESNIKRGQEPRNSIVSSIYVDMSAPSKINESVEMPPPLPPRRRISNHVYTTINMQAENVGKSRKSTWNLKNVFGRTKSASEASKSNKAVEVVKSQTTAGISKLCTNECPTNLLATCKNSFSTPDLTNIIETPKVSTAPVKCETEETDLDVMDIERSNSLNCSTNQFACRPAPLNISDNILWSHNLSLTLSSTVETSAINLVGANVNGRDSFLGRDSSGYCKMAPIFPTNGEGRQLMRTSTTKFEDQLTKSNQLIDSSSIYCTMAPILPPKIDVPVRLSTEATDSNILKNITFERTFDIDVDRSSILDCSMKSIENYNHASSLSDITTSSGVSSYDDSNIAINTNARCITPFNTSNDDRKDNDDAISLTYTESPPQSAQSSYRNNENPFVYHSSKFDAKTPSYFPNENTSPSAQDSAKYTVNMKGPKLPAKTRRKSTDPVAIPVNKEIAEMVNLNQPLYKTPKKQVMKGVLNTPSSGKVQKLKQRRGSVPENNPHFDLHPNALTYKNDNMQNENCFCHHKSGTLPHKFDTKKVLSHLDPNTRFESNRHSNFEKNPKAKSKASPRRIYFTLASRLKTPPSTPTDITPDDRLNHSLDSAMRSTKAFQMANGADTSSNSLIRSWARFRKIDFSPLKTKINSIWQKPSSEY